jgi:hypothetical protein
MTPEQFIDIDFADYDENEKFRSDAHTRGILTSEEKAKMDKECYIDRLPKSSKCLSNTTNT